MLFVTFAYTIFAIYLFILPNILYSLAFIGLVLIGVFDEIFGWMRSMHKRVVRAKKEVHHASKSDTSWDESSIMQLARELINHYRVDWEAKDFVAISHYSTDRFSYHNRLFLEALNNQNRSFSVDAEIVDIEVVNARDEYDREQDSFTLYVTSDNEIELKDDESGKVVVSKSGELQEVYEIEREDNDWKLSSAAIADQGDPLEYALFNNYAHSMGYYYNNRSSYLLLPYNDTLSFFSFKDTSHMVIGIHSNLLINIFLLQAPSKNNYIVSTTTLPGKYPHIFIRNRAVTDLPTTNLHRVTLEWPEFNENYELFIDDVSSEKILLSLLTPDLVKYLLELPGPISIEILQRSAYIIFANKEELLEFAPEILANLHRLALTSLATKALLGN